MKSAVAMNSYWRLIFPMTANIPSRCVISSAVMLTIRSPFNCHPGNDEVFGVFVSIRIEMAEKILLVDDDLALARMVARVLREAEYAPVLAHTAEDGVHLAQVEQPELILLDVMVPSMGGWAACRRIRQFSDAPIMFLTALGDVENIVRGLEIGADDYIVKPFDQAEFLARIKAHLRRAGTAVPTAQTYTFNDGALIVDVAAHTVVVNGRQVDLTPREFDLLQVLVERAGQVVPTAELVKKAWGMTDEDALHNIKPYIHYLRRKIEADPAAPRWILTVRGLGYRMAVTE